MLTQPLVQTRTLWNFPTYLSLRGQGPVLTVPSSPALQAVQDGPGRSGKFSGMVQDGPQKKIGRPGKKKLERSRTARKFLKPCEAHAWSAELKICPRGWVGREFGSVGRMVMGT